MFFFVFLYVSFHGDKPHITVNHEWRQQQINYGRVGRGGGGGGCRSSLCNDLKQKLEKKAAEAMFATGAQNKALAFLLDALIITLVIMIINSHKL